MNAYTRTLRDAILRSDFYAFARKAFEVLRPGLPLKLAWYLELVAQDLVDVMDGKVRRLIVNALVGSISQHSLCSMALLLLYPRRLALWRESLAMDRMRDPTVQFTKA